MYQVYRYVGITILTILLVGCGGSGGSSTSDYNTDTSSISGTSDYNSDISSINNEAAKNITEDSIGARPVTSTPVSKGTLFASPNGSGNSCTETTPCSLDTANTKLSAGDVLFLRGGTYPLSMDGLQRVNIYAYGTAAAPIIIESYPGETAVIDGAALSPLVDVERQQGTVRLGGDYLRLRKIEVKNMPEKGILVEGDNCIVEGCTSHHNHLAGINAFDVAGLIIRDNTVYANSDVGLTNWNYDNGNNADGISASYTHSPLLEHNTVYGNSDDGVDCWGSNDSMLKYNISSDHGKLGGTGNGQGFKLGGQNNNNNQAHFNIAHSNSSSGFDISELTNLNAQYINNVAWNNGGYGFIKLDNIGNVVANNIELNNGIPDNGAGIQSNNSWQRGGTVTFISTDPASPDFLRPTAGGGFEDIGVYASTAQ